MPTASILTSDRYIAIKHPTYGITYNKTLRILTKDEQGTEIILPCRWNPATHRLESVALDRPNTVPAMYEVTKRLTASLKTNGYDFHFLTEQQAKDLTS